MGQTVACNQSFGTLPDEYDLLNIILKGILRECLKFFKNTAGIPSGPADEELLILFITLQTFSGLKSISGEQTLLVRAGKCGRMPSSWTKTDPKKLFNKLARVVSSEVQY